VDDAIAFRRLLDRILSQSGYQVVQCRDGKEAVEMLSRPGERLDLVISDIEMPRLDGFALLREIRSHSQWHSLPVVMLTSRENQRHRQKAMSLGATAYFTKPFPPDELLNAIAALLA
jgi:type IV pili sensor histidine kinase/response regulator